MYSKKIAIKIKRSLHYLLALFNCEISKKKKDTGLTKIVFFPFQYTYTCNPKYICEELLRRNKGWKIYWVVKNKQNSETVFPREINPVVFDTVEYYKAIIGSRILVANAFCFTKGLFSLRKGQYYLQTMHGSLGLKRIDSQAVKNKRRNRKAQKDASLTSYIFSNSLFETEVYEQSFWKKETILETGHARNDVFFWDEMRKEVIRNKVFDYYGLEKNRKLALFAPTVRLANEKYKTESLDFQMVVNSLEQKYGGKWIVLYRKHHSMKEENASIPSFVINANEYTDIQELMIAVDFAITDYSSWIFDYILSRKPGILYAPDLENYDQQRGFYYPISEVPFPVVRSNKEFKEAVMSFDDTEYSIKTDIFMAKRGCIDDGKAAARIVDMMETLDEQRVVH